MGTRIIFTTAKTEWEEIRAKRKTVSSCFSVVFKLVNQTPTRSGYDMCDHPKY